MNKRELYTQSGVAMTCRSYAEYEEMFMLELDSLDLEKVRILDIAAGASSFTAELISRGVDAVAVDPLYQLTSDSLTTHGKKEIEIASQKLSKNMHRFVWTYYNDLKIHDEIRYRSLEKFIDSFKRDRNKNQYIPASLPKLPFSDEEFTLVFCNHFLFLYQEQFDYNFHITSIQEMARVTKKGGSILIYPLVGFKDEVYPQLDDLKKELEKSDLRMDLMETDFRFLPSASHFLRINK